MHLTNIKTQRSSLISDYLSEIELYYNSTAAGDLISLSGDEFHHLVNVMRHSKGNEVWVTDGKGNIYKCRIDTIAKDYAELWILKKLEYDNAARNIFLCLPYLKNNDRLEFALEKCTELGITRFIIFTSERTIARSSKSDRWNKIVLSAMKQSLRSFLPEVQFYNLKEMHSLTGEKILFDQKSEMMFNRSLIQGISYLIIGPEGGFSSAEIKLFKGSSFYKLAPNRLRSETAAVVAASLLI